MTLTRKIVAGNLILAAISAALLCISGHGYHVVDFGFFYGLVSLTASIVDLFAGLIMFAFKNKNWANGLLMRSAMFFIIGALLAGKYFLQQ